MKKLVMIHTTPATLQSLTKLALEEMPDVEVVNILDDSLLKDMIAGKNPELAEQRWMTYASVGEMIKADVILSACSTVGEFAEKADSGLSVPVLRIDEAMAREAVEKGKRIHVFATLQSTMNPTVSLIRRRAQAAGAECIVETHLVEGAYDWLMAGNRHEHDRRIREEVMLAVPKADVIVLAQASMAGALEGMDKADVKKVLTSPRSGMRYVKETMNRVCGKEL